MNQPVVVTVPGDRETVAAGGEDGKVRAGHRAAAAVALAAVLAFYGWTSFTNARTFPTQMDFEGRDYFNLLTDAFLQGRTSLLVEPSPELLALDDPYDPSRNYLAYRVHDLSLYEGKYYLYWGPTPVLTLFAPARLLLRSELPERAAITMYAFVGLLFSLLLFRWLVRRYLPGTPRWMLWFGGVALATSNVMPFLLRRPTVYEVAISAGFCFMVAAVYFVLTGALAERPSVARLAAGSACLGFAVGARLTMAVAGLLFVGVLVHLLIRQENRTWSATLRLAASLLGPAALCAGLLLLYNQVRFDSFTEFGVRYQLNDLKPYPPGGLHYVPGGLYYYLLAPARFDLNFPFLHLPPPPPYPGTVPSTYNVEPVGGLLAVSPITLLAIGLPFAFRQSGGRFRELGLVLLGLAAVGGTTAFALASWSTASMRYAADFTTWFLIVGVVAWILLTSRAASLLTRRAVAGIGALLILYGAVVGVAISFTGTTDGLRTGNPGLFESLERAARALPTMVTMVRGGPAIADVSAPAGVNARVDYRTVTRRGASFRLGPVPAMVEVISPDDRDALLRAVVSPASSTTEAGLVLVTRSPSGSATSPVPATPATTDLPVRLRRGGNRVELRVEATAPSLGDGPSDRSLLVEITDLRLASPSSG